MKRWIIGCSLALLMAAAGSVVQAETPTVDAVQQEIKQGNYVQAEAMMRDVVAAKPGSAKAHYIYAELLAHGGRFEMAAQEARTAKQLDPAVKFTQPDKFASFEQLLDREQQRARDTTAQRRSTAPAVVDAPVQRTQSGSSSGLPGWLWGVGGLILVVALYRMFTRSAGQPIQSAMPMQSAGMAGGGAGYGGYGVNPGYGPGVAPMRQGSGLLGTGIAAAGGFAAGMLAEDLLKGRHDGASASDGNYAPPASGGNDYANELEQRPVDFGSGSSWDDGGSGGSSDGGSSDDGGGW